MLVNNKQTLFEGLVYHVHWERSMDEGRGQLIQPQSVEGCLNAGPGAGIRDQIVARLATLQRVCVQLCWPTPAVFTQWCLEVGSASQIC